MILDLKTTSQDNGASPDAFTKAIANYQYYIQAYWYMMITGAKNFYFIVIETKEPYTIGVYKLDYIALEFAEKEVKRALEIYVNLNKYTYNAYLDCANDYSLVHELSLPNYVFYKNGVQL